MLSDKPEFSLHIDISGCMGFCQINGSNIDLGVPFEAMMMGGPMEFDWPVNHWIREGRNELLMLLAPGEDGGFSPTSSCKMTLRVKRIGEDSDKKLDISAIEFSGELAGQGTGIEGNTPAGKLNSSRQFASDDHGDVVIEEANFEIYGPGAAIVSRGFTLPGISLPKWEYLESDDITELSGVDIAGRAGPEVNQQLKNEMFPFYQNIWNALDSKNVEEILPLFEERNREIDAAFFKEPGSTGKALADSLQEAVSDPDRTLWPVSEDNAMAEIQDNNKLVRLAQNNSRPLLAFDFAGGGSNSYDIVLRKSGGNWIITR